MDKSRKQYLVCIPDSEEFEAVLRYILLLRKRVNISDVYIENDTAGLKLCNSDVKFIKSGVGKVATFCNLNEYFAKSYDKIFLLGTSYGLPKDKGVYYVANSFQEIDLTPVGRLMGESPDCPMYYEPALPLTGGELANSLTAERFCQNFPDLSKYDVKLSSKPVLVNMEDYAFCALLESKGFVHYSIIRGVSDSGDFEDWSQAVSATMYQVLDKFFKEIGVSIN